MDTTRLEIILDRLKNAEDINRQNQGSRIFPGVWHPELEAEEFVIISDHFNMVIFSGAVPLCKYSRPGRGKRP